MATNWAAEANGGTAAASNFLSAAYSPAKANNGVRHTNNNLGNNVPNGSAWTSSEYYFQSPGYQTWEVAFAAAKTINDIKLFFVPDSGDNSTDPSTSDTATTYNPVNYEVFGYIGGSWVSLFTVTGNNKVRRDHSITPTLMSGVRFKCSNANGAYVRLVELEAWGVEALEITTSSLPNGLVGSSYSQQLEAIGGTGSLNWDEVGIVTGLPDGLSLSSTGLISGTPTVSGTFTFTVEVVDSASVADTQTLSITIDEIPEIDFPYGFTQQGIELFCEANQMSQANSSEVTSFTDISAHARHLTGTSSYPTFQTNVINGKPIIRNSGAQNLLKNAAVFTVRCGWIVAKYNGSNFSDYKGLLSDTNLQGILVGNNSGTNFFDFLNPNFEFRSNDRIYPGSAAPAPMNGFKLIFFRFWFPITVNGIQIFQDRAFTARKWNGDIALLILSSKDYDESEIRARSEEIASGYGLTLADVYAYQPDVGNTPEKPVQTINFYDPPEGDRISEVLSPKKRTFELNFSGADQKEAKYMKNFHDNHHEQALAFIYRDYRVTPPEDIEGYFDSHYDLDGAYNDWTYSFKFREK